MRRVGPRVAHDDGRREALRGERQQETRGLPARVLPLVREGESLKALGNGSQACLEPVMMEHSLA